MNAPNKIYVVLDERSGFLSHTFTNVPCGYESSQDIEYIRKDALLEWANHINKMQTAPIQFVAQLLIDKINSL